jgi:hypothetical protein
MHAPNVVPVIVLCPASGSEKPAVGVRVATNYEPNPGADLEGVCGRLRCPLRERASGMLVAAWTCGFFAGPHPMQTGCREASVDSLGIGFAPPPVDSRASSGLGTRVSRCGSTADRSGLR